MQGEDLVAKVLDDELAFFDEFLLGLLALALALALEKTPVCSAAMNSNEY